MGSAGFDPRLRYFCAGKILPNFRGRGVVWRLDFRDAELSEERRQGAMTCYNDQFSRFSETEKDLYVQYIDASQDVLRRAEQAKSLPGFNMRMYVAERERLSEDFKKAREARWDQFRLWIRTIKPWQ